MTTNEQAAPALKRPHQERPINRTMSRNELLLPEAQPLIGELNSLIRRLQERGVYPSAWLGTVPGPDQGSGAPQGLEQRLRYEPLPEAADDGRLPWFLYWEIHAVLEVTRPLFRPGLRLLDAGGASSLFAFYLASLGHEVHAIDLEERLIDNARKVSQAMGWSNMHSHIMNMRSLEFPDAHFDLAYSICVFEHLDYPIKQEALQEMGRCLKPGGLLSITFDYRNPAPGVRGCGKDPRLRNRISTPEDIQRTFLETGLFEVAGNQKFHDNGDSYLVHPLVKGGEYTFGAIFLRKLAQPRPLAIGPLDRAPEDDAHPALFLSAIVCTYKRPHLLRNALTSLLEQDLPRDRFEVIVVDNNSGDGTGDVVREFARKAPNIRYVHETKQGLSNSRNRGCEEARGDYLVYLDDDARAHPSYLLRIYQTIRAERPDILGGPIYPYYTAPRRGWFKDEYEIRQHADQTGWSTTCSISGSSFIIRPDLLRSLGMFDPRLGMVGDSVRLGEERAVLNRYRQRPVEQQKVYYHLGCVVYHHVPPEKMTPRYFLKRHFWAGLAKARIEGQTRGRWGPLARAGYLARSAWGRLRSPLLDPKTKRRIKQDFLECGAGFLFEVGRALGCLPRIRRKRHPESPD